MLVETASTVQPIISYVITRIETIVLIDLPVDNGRDSAYQLILLHILVQFSQGIIDRGSNRKVDTTLIVQDTRFHAQQIIPLTFHEIRIIPLHLKFFRLQEIARIKLVGDSDRHDIQIHQIQQQIILITADTQHF